jgi:iron-sulfur cluster repair protein YtfE (RIC family)
MGDNPPRHPSDATVEQLIVGEHAIMREHHDHMRSVADDAQRAVPLTLRHLLDAVLSFLHTDLVSHIQTEEEVIYPAFDCVADADWSSRAMRLDHEAITDMLGQLDQVIADIRRARWLDEVQRLLFVLEAVIRLHLDKEDRMSAPLLGQLDSRAGESLRQRLAGHSIQHHHAPWGFSAHPKP